MVKNYADVDLTDTGYFEGLIAAAKAANQGKEEEAEEVHRRDAADAQQDVRALLGGLTSAQDVDAVEAALAAMLAFLKAHKNMFDGEDAVKASFKKDLTQAAKAAKATVGEVGWPKLLFGMVLKCV